MVPTVKIDVFAPPASLLPRYPIYVVSKGRWESRLTARWLERENIPYHIVVEPQEYAQYAAVIDPSKILTLPFSNLGQGSIPARNWCWDHALRAGYRRHWVLDDNIARAAAPRLRRADGTIARGRRLPARSALCMIEDYTERFVNVVIAGPNYEAFTNAPGNVRINARVYSCLLIDTALPLRWRGQYNEDTDLCIRALREGYCTALFQTILVKKTRTMRMRGGNTDELYRQQGDFDGRLEMARSLVAQHPDLAYVHWRWGRWQHRVRYRRIAQHDPIPLPREQWPPREYDWHVLFCPNGQIGAESAQT